MTNYELMQLDAEWWLLTTRDTKHFLHDTGYDINSACKLFESYKDAEDNYNDNHTFDDYSWFSLLVAEAEKDLDELKPGRKLTERKIQQIVHKMNEIRG